MGLVEPGGGFGELGGVVVADVFEAAEVGGDGGFEIAGPALGDFEFVAGVGEVAFGAADGFLVAGAVVEEGGEARG